MTCPDCARWNPDEERCRDGKVNPQSWSQAAEVANALGVRSICLFNDHREKLVASRCLKQIKNGVSPAGDTPQT